MRVPAGVVAAPDVLQVEGILSVAVTAIRLADSKMLGCHKVCAIGIPADGPMC